MIKPHRGDPEKSKIELVRNAARIIMPTLMRLLEIRIEASRCSGLSSNPIIILLVLLCSSSIFLSSLGLSEKNADSDPEIMLDIISSTISTKMPVITPVVTG